MIFFVFFDMMLDRKKFYKSIKNLDDKIKFVIIVDTLDVTIFGGQQEGVENYLSVKPSHSVKFLPSMPSSI